MGENLLAEATQHAMGPVRLEQEEDAALHQQLRAAQERCISGSISVRRESALRAVQLDQAIRNRQVSLFVIYKQWWL